MAFVGAIAVSSCPEKQSLVSCTAKTTFFGIHWIQFSSFHVGASSTRAVQAASMFAKDRSKLVTPQSQQNVWLVSALKDGLPKTSVITMTHTERLFMCDAAMGTSIERTTLKQVAGRDNAKRTEARRPGTPLNIQLVNLQVEAMKEAAATFLQDTKKCDNCDEAYAQFAAASAQPGAQAVMAATMWCAVGEAMKPPVGAPAATSYQQQQQDAEAAQQRKRRRAEEEEAAQRKKQREWDAEQQRKHQEQAAAEQKRQKEQEAAQRQQRRRRAAEQAAGPDWFGSFFGAGAAGPDIFGSFFDEMFQPGDDDFFGDLRNMFQARRAQQQQQQQQQQQKAHARAHHNDQRQQQDQGQQQRRDQGQQQQQQQQHQQQQHQRKQQQQGAGCPAAAAGKGGPKLAELCAAVPQEKHLPVAELQRFLVKQVPAGAVAPDLKACSADSKNKVFECQRLMACGDAMAAHPKSSVHKKQYALALLRLDGAGSSSSSSKEAFTKQSKAAYMQLALLVHPDKAPAELGAVTCIFEAAFKALGAAKEVLA